VIRVLIASHSGELETAIRSSASLEFAGRTDPSQPFGSELSADVLLVEFEEASDHDWSALAELPIPVILLMDPTNSALANSALRSGIRGAISSDATVYEIEAAANAVVAGLAVTIPDFLRELHPFAEELLEPLSGRELEVLDQLAEGLSNKLIAHRLNISEHTVKTHVGSIFAKLGASSRTEAVSQAIRRGLVML
jgi:two-component system, NarL family, response regulator YdfI